VADEATQSVGDVDSGAEDEGCALVEHVAGEAEMPSSSPVGVR
jgi:hypothetical protein